MDNARYLVALLIIAVALFDYLSLLSLLPRITEEAPSPFIISVEGDVDGQGRVTVIRTTVTYNGDKQLAVSEQTITLFIYNFTQEVLMWRGFEWRSLDSENHAPDTYKVFTKGRSLQVVQVLVPRAALLPGTVLEVGFRPSPLSGLPNVNATYHLPLHLAPGTTVDLEPNRLPSRVFLEQDNFSIHTYDTTKTTVLMRMESVAIPVMVSVLLFLLVLILRQEGPWFRSLGRRWWTMMAVILVIALLLRLWYGAHFQRTLLLNNMRNPRFAQLFVAGSDIFWIFGAGHPYILSIVYAAMGTGMSAGGAEAVAMAMSLTVSLAHVLLLGLLGAALFSPQAGVAAASLLALLPLDILYATAVRRDGLASFFITLSLFFMVRGSRSRYRAHFYAGAVALGMAVFTVRPLMVILIPWLAFLVLGCGLRSHQLKGPLAFLLLVAILPAFALMLEAMTLLDEIPILGGMILTPDYLASNAAWMVYYLFGGDHHASLITLLAMAGVLSIRNRSFGAAASLAGIPLIIAIFLVVHRVPIAYCTQHRHLMYLYPTLILLGGEGVSRVTRYWRERYGNEPWFLFFLVLGYVVVVHMAHLSGILALRRCA